MEFTAGGKTSPKPLLLPRRTQLGEGTHPSSPSSCQHWMGSSHSMLIVGSWCTYGSKRKFSYWGAGSLTLPQEPKQCPLSCWKSLRGLPSRGCLPITLTPCCVLTPWLFHVGSHCNPLHFTTTLRCQLLWDKPRQHIKKQRHHCTNEGPSSQSPSSPSNQTTGLSSSHVWMWELDHKEGWAQNWCF